MAYPPSPRWAADERTNHQQDTPPFSSQLEHSFREYLLLGTLSPQEMHSVEIAMRIQLGLAG
jgi:hypothetical protein